MATKKYTRKQLRQPDEFISFSFKMLEVLKANMYQVLVALGVLIVIVGAVWTYQYFSHQSATTKTAAWTDAVGIYGQMLLPKDTKPADIKKEEGEPPRFKTNNEKLEATDKALSKVVDEGGNLGELGQLMRAAVRYERAQYSEAIKDYRAFVNDNDDPRMIELAYEGLGYCYEATKAWDKAVEAFGKIPGQGGKTSYKAMYHQARVLGYQGKKKEAIELLRKVLDKVPDTALADRAGQQLALVEGK